MLKEILVKRSMTFFILFLTFSIIGNSQATPIVKVGFNGTVSTYFVDPVNDFANPDPNGGSISPGTLIDGHFFFDLFAATPTPNPPPTTGIASYTSTGLPYGISVNIGGTPFDIFGALNIGIANDIGAGIDQYTVFAERGIPGGLNDYLSLQLFLQDSTSAVFNNAALTPLTGVNIQSFDVRNFFLDGVQTINGTTYQFQVQGDITDAILAVNIPEPNAAVLMMLGLMILSYIGYKRRRVIN